MGFPPSRERRRKSVLKKVEVEPGEGCHAADEEEGVDRGPDGEVALELLARLAADDERAIVGRLLDAVLRERRLLRDLGHHLGARLCTHAVPFGLVERALAFP